VFAHWAAASNTAGQEPKVLRAHLSRVSRPSGRIGGTPERYATSEGLSRQAYVGGLEYPFRNSGYLPTPALMLPTDPFKGRKSLRTLMLSL
jgi:hypothetical protein